MTILASDLITLAVTQYQDDDFDRVTEADWILFINSALRKLLEVRPDANPVTEAFLLSPGTKQAIPDDKIRFIDISMNLGSNGATPGVPVTMVDRNSMDGYRPGWHTDTATTYIDHFIFNLAKPKEFWVYPPVHDSTNVYVDMTCSEIPTVITATGDTVEVDDIFEDPLVSWLIYKALSIDTDSDEDWGKALHYLKAFYQALGIELKSGVYVAPKTKGKTT